MKIWRIIAISIFALVMVGASACSFGGDQNQAAQKVAVTTGDLIIKVNGTGKAAYATDAKLSFGTPGKIEKLSIKKGDTVTKGSVLAKLDTRNLELALSQAKVAEGQAGLAITAAESSLTQAESALSAAQFNLDRTKAVGEIKDAITNVEWTIKAAQINITQALAVGDTTSVNFLNQYIAANQIQLFQQQKKLADLLAKEEYAGTAVYEFEGQKYDRLVVQDVRMKAQQVELAEQAVEQAEKNIAQARLNLEQASKAVEVARTQIDEATIVAPINGVVVSLEAKEGDFVTAPGAGPALIYLVDPASLEMNTEVDEIDVAGVKVNQKAVISLDALPNASFEGNVSAISITPVIKPLNSGVVVYEVKVRFAAAPPVEVKSGMSASIDIVTQEKKDVVLVPNKSIKKNSQGQTVVDVIVNQKTEQRVVVLGQSDGVQTEIVSGLNIGEMVIKPLKETNGKLS